MSETPFQLALRHGLKSEAKFGRLEEAFQPLGDDFKITSGEDAKVLADAIISTVRTDPDLGLISFLSELLGLLSHIGSKAAADTINNEAMPVLEELFDRQATSGTSRGSELGSLLKIFGMCGRREGFDRIVQAIRSNVDCRWYWTQIFRPFGSKHPLLPDLLKIPLSEYPHGFVRVALLDHCNRLAIDGKIEAHPFDCQEGNRQLSEWLAHSDPEHFSYAQSAVVALPFISNPERDQLLALAMDHLSINTQLEAAWAGVKVGYAGGIKFLSRACADPATYARASKYLVELGHQDAIPKQCNEPDFIAEASARWWLEHPNEFGRQPDEITLLDSRTIFWPPADGQRRLHLFRYRYVNDDAREPDTLGVVMTGGKSTFSLFSESNADMSAEDVYALHCCWELEMLKDPRAPDKRSPAAGRRLLNLPPA